VTRITGTLYEDSIFMIVPRSVLRMRSAVDKCCGDNQNTRFIFDEVFLKIVPFMR
jgi:hypothetical protein